MVGGTFVVRETESEAAAVENPPHNTMEATVRGGMEFVL